ADDVPSAAHATTPTARVLTAVIGNLLFIAVRVALLATGRPLTPLVRSLATPSSGSSPPSLVLGWAGRPPGLLRPSGEVRVVSVQKGFEAGWELRLSPDSKKNAKGLPNPRR